MASSSANTTEFESNFGSNSFEKLNSLLTPEYYNLFKSLSRVSDGAKTIIKIREDLLDIIEKSKRAFVSFIRSYLLHDLKFIF